MLTLDDIKLELAKRVTERRVELCKILDNPLAVANVIMLEELARLEFRQRELARAAQTLGWRNALNEDIDESKARLTLHAIAEGKDLP